MVASRGAYRVLVGRPEVKRPLGRQRLRWDGNIKVAFLEWDGTRGGLFSML
jgi:hypothetical protein